MINKNIERKIKKIYTTLYNIVFNQETIDDLIVGERSRTILKMNRFASSSKYQVFAELFAKELAKLGVKKNNALLKKYYYEIAKKTHYVFLPSTFAKYEMQVYQKALENNFNMIKSIPQRMIEILNRDYTDVLLKEVALGRISRGSFKRGLQSHGIKQANVIARTKTAKLQSIIIKSSAQEIGSKAYFWRSSNDSRTRPTHRLMNKVIVFYRDYDEKPLLDKMRGDAGEFPNCRCDIQPILDLEELKDVTYKLYDYKQNKIINIKNRDLKYFLKKGEL